MHRIGCTCATSSSDWWGVPNSSCRSYFETLSVAVFLSLSVSLYLSITKVRESASSSSSLCNRKGFFARALLVRTCCRSSTTVLDLGLASSTPFSYLVIFCHSFEEKKTYNYYFFVQKKRVCIPVYTNSIWNIDFSAQQKKSIRTVAPSSVQRSHREDLITISLVLVSERTSDFQRKYREYFCSNLLAALQGYTIWRPTHRHRHIPI